MNKFSYLSLQHMLDNILDILTSDQRQISYPAGDLFANRETSRRGGRRSVQHMNRTFRINDVKVINKRAISA